MKTALNKAIADLAKFYGTNPPDFPVQASIIQLQFIADDIKSSMQSLSENGATTENTSANLDDAQSAALLAKLKSGFNPILNDLFADQGFIAPMSVITNLNYTCTLAAAGSNASSEAAAAQEAEVASAPGSTSAKDFQKPPDIPIPPIEDGLTAVDRRMMIGAIGGFAWKPPTFIKSMCYGKNLEKLIPADSILRAGMDAEVNDPPSKDAPQMHHIQVLDPRVMYGKSSGALLELTSRHIPSIEWSKCVPFFKLEIVAEPLPGYDEASDRTEMRNPLDMGFYLDSGAGDVIREGTFGVDPTLVESGSAPAVGMEAFTMPQSIFPRHHSPGADHYKPRFRASLAGTQFASVDPTRPFMSVLSFKEKVTPTRGPMSTKTATLTLVLHDRRRISQLESILSPADLSKVEMHIEYGWSHPDADITRATADGPKAANVYGPLLNSMRAGGIYSPYKVSMSLDKEGQVNITLELISKGASTINIFDASMTGKLSPGWAAVETAFEAFKSARTAAAAKKKKGLNRKYISDLAGTAHIQSLTLGSTGDLLDAKKLKEIRKFIAKVQKRQDPLLNELTTALTQLGEAVRLADATMQKDLEDKVGHLTGTSVWNKNLAALNYGTYGDLVNTMQIFDHTQMGTGNFINYVTMSASPAVCNPAILSGGKGRGITSLGLLLQLFVVQPLASTGMFDEVQLVTYCANHNAGFCAGTNLSALPIDMRATGGKKPKTFLQILQAEYKKYGGQFPINRFMSFIADNFIELESSLCYKLNEGATRLYDPETGTISVKDSQNVGLDQQKVAKKLRKAYYDSESEGDILNPTREKFTPINLKIHFEVGDADSKDLIRRLEDANALGDNMVLKQKFDKKFTTLRIHVVDTATVAAPGIIETFNEMRGELGTAMVSPKSRLNSWPGIDNRLVSINGADTVDIDGRVFLEQALAAGIFSGADIPGDPLSPEELAEMQADLEELQATIDTGVATNNSGDEEVLEIDPADMQAIEEMADDLRNRIANGETVSPGTVYNLACGPQELIQFISNYFPTVVFGEEGSSVVDLKLSSDTNSKIATVRMLQNAQGSAGGDFDRGLPMRTTPMRASMTMIGNPFVRFMQKFFIMADTGSTIDNLYAVSGVSHEITPDNFVTNVELVPQSAYGTFYAMSQEINKLRAANAVYEKEAAD